MQQLGRLASQLPQLFGWHPAELKTLVEAKTVTVAKLMKNYHFTFAS